MKAALLGLFGFITCIIAQAGEAGGGADKPPVQPGAGAGGGIESLLVMLVPMVLIFYFLLIRPESKRRKEKETLMSALKPKDEVVTIGGLCGTVAHIEGDMVVLIVDQKKDIRVRYRRSAIDFIVQPQASKEGEKK